jgi:predicted TIM-barrel fold metal-dependent hydrolase
MMDSSASTFTHQLDSLLDLASLPWFDLVDGRLTAPSIGPVIDSHAHLAQGYVLPMRVDLHAAPRPTEHYLPIHQPCDLDIYANQCLSEEQRAEVYRDLVLRSFTSRGMRQTHTIPNLLREMAEHSTTHTVVLPVDLPGLSRNAHHFLEATRDVEGLIAFGSVHPLSRHPERKLEEQVALGARGIKFHPGFQFIYPDNRRAMRLYAQCGGLGIPVLFHCGPVGIAPGVTERRHQVRHYLEPVRRYSGTKFILGHSGALQVDEALDLAKEYTNVYLELSSQSLPNVRRICAEIDPQRILYGSDWPFYHQALPLVKVLIATEGQPALRRRILYENAAGLLGIEA